jgi:hypothetical protein
MEMSIFQALWKFHGDVNGPSTVEISWRCQYSKHCGNFIEMSIFQTLWKFHGDVNIPSTVEISWKSK